LKIQLFSKEKQKLWLRLRSFERGEHIKQQIQQKRRSSGKQYNSNSSSIIKELDSQIKIKENDSTLKEEEAKKYKRRRKQQLKPY
jgi:hypothetical protein